MWDGHSCPPGFVTTNLPPRSAWFLIDPNHISRRIAKSRRNLRSVPTDRLHNLAPVCHNQIHCSGHTVDHDVNQQSWLCSSWPVDYPFPAHFADAVVKRGAMLTLPNV